MRLVFPSQIRDYDKKFYESEPNREICGLTIYCNFIILFLLHTTLKIKPCYL